jgi:hypothetical protein
VNDGAGDDVAPHAFGAPPFKADEALVQMRRALRALGGLTERGQQFEWKGRPVVALAVDGAQLQVRLARRLAVNPDWESRTLKNGAEVRKFGDDVKQRVARWRESDD